MPFGFASGGKIATGEVSERVRSEPCRFNSAKAAFVLGKSFEYQPPPGCRTRYHSQRRTAPRSAPPACCQLVGAPGARDLGGLTASAASPRWIGFPPAAIAVVEGLHQNRSRFLARRYQSPRGYISELRHRVAHRVPYAASLRRQRVAKWNLRQPTLLPSAIPRCSSLPYQKCLPAPK